MAISFRLVVDAAASYATGPVASMSHHAPPLTVLATGLLVDSASAYRALSPTAATRGGEPRRVVEVASGSHRWRARQIQVLSLGVPSAASSRRRNPAEDVTLAPKSRARSASRLSEVTTVKNCGAGSSARTRTISSSAALRPAREANATAAAPCLPGWTSAGRRSNTTVTSWPVAAAYLSSSWMSRRTAWSGADQVHAVDQQTSPRARPACNSVLITCSRSHGYSTVPAPGSG